MVRIKIASVICLAICVMIAPAHAFDYDSYTPGNLDEVLQMPRPKSGVDVISLQKLQLTVKLESYAEQECALSKTIQLSMRMLRDLYPQQVVDSVSMSKCVKVKSPKGSIVSVAIQDKVADFLPKEVPLGTEIKVYCLLICMTADAPGLLISEFEGPEESKGE
jgi:hypothetical protein